jgi:hypothetical protein
MFKIRIAPNISALVLTIFVISSLKSQINSTSFASKVDFSVGSGTQSPYGIATADFNGDGKVDIATSNSSSNSISVFSNNSSGMINSSSLGSPISLTTGLTPQEIFSDDIDKDGKMDLLTANYGGNSISILRNTSIMNGTISFASKVDYAVGNNSSCLFLEDLNGDGNKEIVNSNFGSNTISIHQNISTPGTILLQTPRIDIAVSGTNASSARELTIEDVDGDAKRDIIVVYYNGYVAVFRNTSSITAISFAPSVNLTGINLNAGISVADIDLDGKKDITVSSYLTGVVLVYKNNCTLGSISFSSFVSYSVGVNPQGNKLIDLDGDNKPEMIVSNRGTNNISIFRNFATQSVINTSTMANRVNFSAGTMPIFAQFADIDGDGKPEMITSNYNSHTISVFKNQTKPSNGLIAHYPFNGNAGDSSGFENHGTVFSGVSNTTDRKNVANKAFTFNGSTNAYINVPANVSLNTANLNNITISCWFKASLTIPAIQRRIFNIQSSTAVNYDLSYDQTIKKLVFINWNGTSAAIQFNSTDTFSLNTWHFVALVIDSTNTTKLYVNGVLQGTSTNTVVKPVNPILSIGRHLTGGWNFDGAIDEFRVYDKALTLAQINELGRDNPVYYSKAIGNLSALSTWGTNTDGSGTAPLSFDSSNVTYNVLNNASPTLGGTLRINGANSTLVFGDGTNAFNLVIGNNDTLSCDSMYIQNSITLTNSGTLVCTRLDAANSSNVQYIRSTPQSIAAGSYGNLVVSSATKTLTGNTSIKGILGMLASIQCNNFSLTLGTSSTNTGTLSRTSGTIIGRFIRWFANTTNTGATGLFPIGNSSKYTPMQMEFTTAPSAGGTISCEFIPANPGNVGLPQFDFSNGLVLIDKTAIDGFWRVVASGVTGGAYTGTVTANNFTGINSFANLRMVRRSAAGSWTLQGTANNTTGSNSAAIVSRTGLTAITGEYGIGGDVSQNPLPVKLTQFSADLLSDKQVLLKWQTVQEINANKFIVKRSTDKQNWTLVGEVKANNNSNRTINYELLDETIKNGSGVVYYQLVQVDLNGDEYVSPIASLNLSKEMFSIIKVYPNPAADKINIEGAAFPINIYDVMGKLVMKVTNEGDLDISHLEKGVYLISDKNSSTKLIKQ